MATFELTAAEALNADNWITVTTWAYAIQASPRYSVRLRTRPFIRVSVPHRTATEPWWPEITNGRIVHTPTVNGSNVRVIYEVPEYWQQPFVQDTSLGIGYDDGVLAARGEEAIILGRRTVAAQRRPLHVVVEQGLTSPDFGMPKRDGNGTPCLRVYRSGSPQDLPIADWHAPSGEITLAQDIDFTDDIRVDYLYRPQGFVYKGYRADATTFYRLDLNPLPGHTYHDPSVGNVPQESSALLRKAVYLYLLPTRIGDTSYPPPYVRHWIASRDRPEQDVINDIKASVTDSNQRAYILLLAVILVRMPYAPWHVRLIDTRRRGGGLLSSLDASKLSASARYQDAEIDQFWDIGRWDGPPYPDHGVFVLRVPAPAPGVLTRERLEAAWQVVREYQVCGTLGVILEDASLSS